MRQIIYIERLHGCDDSKCYNTAALYSISDYKIRYWVDGCHNGKSGKCCLDSCSFAGISKAMVMVIRRVFMCDRSSTHVLVTNPNKFVYINEDYTLTP